MSWDVAIFKMREPPPENKDFPEDFQPLPLGSGEEIKKYISEAIPGVDWTNPHFGSISFPNFAIEFSSPQNGEVEGLMLHIFGSGNPLPIICKICSEKGWYPYDTSLGKFMDLDNPSNEGWEAYKEYRDQIFDHLSGN